MLHYFHLVEYRGLLYIFGFLLVFSALIRFCYCIFFLFPLLRKAGKQSVIIQHNKEVTPVPISVLICARNEASNLKQYLPKVLMQQYPLFEVVVVNDASEDDTIEVLNELKNKHPQLKVVSISPSEKKGAGKRQALQKAIETASYPYFLLTDADCFPASPLWIERMSAHFHLGKQIVLGYGPYIEGKGFLNKLVSYETLHTALRYFSFANAGIPYMGVGRNLGYTKHLFESAGGFKEQMHLVSGDDDLLVNKAATRDNTAIEIHGDAFCYSQAPSGWKEWYRQKARHLGVGKYYSFRHILVLGCFTLSDFLFYGMIIALFFISKTPLLLTALLLVSMILQFVFYYWATRLFKVKGITALIPVFDLLFPVYYIVFAPFMLTAKKISWKR